MGSDFVEYSGHSELFRDFDLWTLRHFLIEETKVVEAEAVADRKDELARLREFFEAWNWVCPGVFSGTDFSEFISGSLTRWDLVLGVLQRTGDRIAAFGEIIPLDYLRNEIDMKGASFEQPQPTQRHLKNIGRICRLLSRREPGAARVRRIPSHLRLWQFCARVTGEPSNSSSRLSPGLGSRDAGQGMRRAFLLGGAGTCGAER